MLSKGKILKPSFILDKPLIIGVTGHRELCITELPYYREQIRNFLIALLQINRNIVIYSSLTDGADRLIVQEGIQLNISFIAVLPLNISLYSNDFNVASMIEFETLLLKADRIKIMPVLNNSNNGKISVYGPARDKQYERAGRYVVNKSKVILAVWDGEHTGLTGGTSETIKYCMKKKVLDLYCLPVKRNITIRNK